MNPSQMRSLGYVLITAYSPINRTRDDDWYGINVGESMRWPNQDMVSVYEDTKC